MAKQLNARHTTSSIVMCHPLHFGFNPETGADNEFQHAPSAPQQDILDAAIREFDHAAQTLSKANIEVLVLEHPAHLHVPDAVFPNNWFTTHQDGTLLIYPMKTPNRQNEVQPELLQHLFKKAGYQINSIESITDSCAVNGILEGTGALIFDRPNKVLFAALSERCEAQLLETFCQHYQWQSCQFISNSSHQVPIYHTNVMMSLGKHFAVIAGESLNEKDKQNVYQQLDRLNKTIIPISLDQTEESFCGNILELSDKNGDAVIAMSQSAFDGFTSSQKKQLELYGSLLPCNIQTIEYVGGGSLRCMIAENFLPLMSNNPV